MKRRTILLMVVGLALGGCTGTTDSPTAREDAESPATLRNDISRDFLGYMRNSEHDYEPAKRPSELARQSDSVITGTIVSVARGQSYAPTPDSRPEITTSVLEIDVDRVVSGSRPVVHEGSIYVEVFHPAFVGSGPKTVEGSTQEAPFDHAAYAQTVPRAYGVFFLEDRTEEPVWPTIVDEGAGRPQGARITQTFVQGFLIEDSEGQLVSVLEPFDAMPPAWHGLDSVNEVLSQL